MPVLTNTREFPALAGIETATKVPVTFDVLGVAVSAVQIPEMIDRMEQWIAERQFCHYVTLTNVHAVMEAHSNPEFKQALNSAAAVCPDGMPLVWLGRMQGFDLQRRVYGPDLLWDFCRATHHKHYSHFFYGGAPGVPERLASELIRAFPGLRVAGCYSPPFRLLNADDEDRILHMIDQASPDVLWIGLGCPKQEYWMHEHSHLIHVPVALGIGQAFDIYAGNTRQAPRWMREHGLEWLFRLVSEPRRLWRRYLVYNTCFIAAVLWRFLRPRACR